jgi:hypothetical protein
MCVSVCGLMIKSEMVSKATRNKFLMHHKHVLMKEGHTLSVLCGEPMNLNQGRTSCFSSYYLIYLVSYF